MFLFQRFIIGLIETWDLLVYGYVRGWDEQRGMHYADPRSTRTRASLIEPALVWGVAAGWVAAMIWVALVLARRG